MVFLDFWLGFSFQFYQVVEMVELKEKKNKYEKFNFLFKKLFVKPRSPNKWMVEFEMEFTFTQFTKFGYHCQAPLHIYSYRLFILPVGGIWWFKSKKEARLFSLTSLSPFIVFFLSFFLRVVSSPFPLLHNSHFTASVSVSVELWSNVMVMCCWMWECYHLCKFTV